MDQKISESVTIPAKYTFTADENHENALQIAQALKDKDAKESELKTVSKQIKSEIEVYTKNIKVLSNYVNDGYRYKDTVCEIWLDFEQKKRIYTDKTSGLTIKSEDFHQSDYQKQLDFEREELRKINETNENNEVGDYANTSSGRTTSMFVEDTQLDDDDLPDNDMFAKSEEE